MNANTYNGHFGALTKPELEWLEYINDLSRKCESLKSERDLFAKMYAQEGHKSMVLQEEISRLQAQLTAKQPKGKT